MSKLVSLVVAHLDDWEPTGRSIIDCLASLQAPTTSEFARGPRRTCSTTSSLQASTSEFALTRHLAECLNGELKAMAAMPNHMAKSINFAFQAKKTWSDSELQAWMTTLLQQKQNDWVLGTCVAFEPGLFRADRADYAFYVFRPSGVAQAMELPEHYKYREWPWYQQPKTERQGVWVEPFFDRDGGNVWMVTHSSPFVRDNAFAGVATIDVPLTEFLRLDAWMSENHFDASAYSFVITGSGSLVKAPSRDSSPASDIPSQREAFETNPAFKDLLAKMSADKQGTTSIDDPLSGAPAMLHFAEVISSGWKLAVVTPQ